MCSTRRHRLVLATVLHLHLVDEVEAMWAVDGWAVVDVVVVDEVVEFELAVAWGAGRSGLRVDGTEQRK
jgi:hypothetical protein